MGAWGRDALQAFFDPVVVISNDPVIGGGLGLPAREDLEPGMGPLGGVATALAWAEEEGLGGAFILGCDLPLVGKEQLGRILAYGLRDRRILVPQSPGPLGVEPLCGVYTVGCGGSARRLLAAGRRAMMALLEAEGYSLVPSEAVDDRQSLSRIFLNVNTPEDARVAESVLLARSGEGGEAPDRQEKEREGEP
jgi:molybdopterin-guanine dinucleotide biosynthesis protein A